MSVLISKIKILLDLVVFKHSLFALPFLFSSMLIAFKLSNELNIIFVCKCIILGIIAAISARSFAMATNRLMDEDIDKNNPRCKNRPNITGTIGRKNVYYFIIANAIIFIITCYFINSLTFNLSIPILIILALYSSFKRFSSLSHLVLGLCLGLAPVAASIMVLEKIELYSVLLCFGVMFWTAGFDLLYSLQDMKYDQKVGLYSIPSQFGLNASLFISMLCHVLAVLFWLLFVWVAPIGYISFLGVVICAIILYYEQKIVRKDFAKIDKAFFTLNAYLSVIFFVFIYLDLVF